jgi:hypothetical protein
MTEQQVPPLRFATVGMTILFLGQNAGAQTEVTSRPEPILLFLTFELRRGFRCRRLGVPRTLPCRFLRGAWHVLRRASDASRPTRARIPATR